MAAEPAGPTVLVVDDDPNQREIARALLEHAGFRVLLAPSAEAALEPLAAGEPVALVLTDVRLPGLDGWSFCHALKTHPDTCELPVIVTSLYDIDPRRIAASGCDRFIPKPWRARTLFDAVRELVAPPPP